MKTKGGKTIRKKQPLSRRNQHPTEGWVEIVPEAMFEEELPAGTEILSEPKTERT